MNHQTAKIIADSYRERAQDLRGRVGTGDKWNGKMFERVMAMDDHAAVWGRVANSLWRVEPEKAPHPKYPNDGHVDTEAPNVP